MLLILTVSLLSAGLQGAALHRGRVCFGAVQIPGAIVQIAQGGVVLRAVTGADGTYEFPDIEKGNWTVQVEAPGFQTARREVVIGEGSAVTEWDLTMQPAAQIKNPMASGFPSAASSPPALQTSRSSPGASPGLLINGTVSNEAASSVSVARAIGNNRLSARSPYTGNVLVTGNSAVFDARSYSLTGQDTPKPDYGRVQASLTVGGPLQIPQLFSLGTFSAVYTRTQNRNGGVQTARVPTVAERAGDFSQSATAIMDPISGIPFSGNVVAPERISPQAAALLDLYPLPNFTGVGRFNYQVPLVGVTHGDNLQGTINNIVLNNSNRLSGTAGFQSVRSDDPDLFGFTDSSVTTTASATVNWAHRFSPRLSANIRYALNRTTNRNSPYFGNRLDVSGDAGIAGGDREAGNWGPPTLVFSSGMARLSAGSYAFDRSLSHGISFAGAWGRVGHAFGFGGDFRRQQFNLLSQQNARGTFTFTGGASGNDFADFLLSAPAASSLALGNADKYFRQSFSSLYFTDDWRLNPAVTLNLGVRWEYESPIVEKFGRLVNLAVTPGFTAATPVVAGVSDQPLLRADVSGIQPRLGVAWRPSAGSSVIIRAGYGLYRDTTVYRAIADEMAQQAPLSKRVSVESTPSEPLSLADGFRSSATSATTTFAVDPRFAVGSAHNWNISVQRDFPAALQITAGYTGIRGLRIPRRVLPNTFASGAPNPCVDCPTGFVYLTSDGTSNRHSGTIELRRRQRNGFEASARYTFSKATDDAGIGGYHIAQNWLDLTAERGLSTFDQRHQLMIQGQFTTGMLAGAGTFWDGWKGRIFKEWTLTSQWTVGSGSPLTPVFFAPVRGTALTGSLRPHATGAPISLRTAGGFLNPAAFTLPPPGEWGNAARNSITGPGQFALNAGLSRTFRVNERISMDFRVDATNVLNRVTFPTYNTTVNSAQFGVPTRANAMRTLQPSLRVRF